jgi:hypothetical protein
MQYNGHRSHLQKDWNTESLLMLWIITRLIQEQGVKEQTAIHHPEMRINDESRSKDESQPAILSASQLPG